MQRELLIKNTPLRKVLHVAMPKIRLNRKYQDLTENFLTAVEKIF